jgi:RNA polymerase sigma-70 factor (ECF subfamily)
MDASARRPLDRKVVEQHYREHGHMVLRRARALLREEQDAREVLQEVFMSLLDRPEQFEQRSSITTWLYVVTTNACLTRMRNQRTRQRLVDERADTLVPGPPGSDAERWAQVRQLLAKLPEELAAVAVHYFLDEMTQQEIAELIGCSRSQVGKLLDRIAVHTQGAAGAAS